ncbi:unnamed protein product [Cochlearia groenlandica]
MENPEGRRRETDIVYGEKVTGSSLVVAAVAAVAVVGPLLCLMSFSLVVTVTLFLALSPLMLIFVPVLAVTVAIVVMGMVGVGLAATMWLMGIVALVCGGREFGVRSGVAERMVEPVVRELGYGKSRYLRDKSDYSSSFPHAYFSS